jgi:flagellar motility protein MotE (MotC chaperone)
MKRRAGHLAVVLLLLVLGGAAAFTADTAGKPSAPPGGSARPSAVDLHALAETVSRRAKDLDLADQRIQEERKLLEKVREEVRQQILVLDRKLAAIEKQVAEREQARLAARKYLSKVFRSMEADDAARRLQIMGERETALILKELKEKDAAKILSRMEPGFSASVARWMEKL